MYIGNGKLVPDQAYQLKEHFKDEQTPVLIGILNNFIWFQGGGVRAFVLMGIDYNETKNEVQFLILNPSFRGKATIEELHDKEFVSWRESSFFLKDNFYNFCLPKAKNITFE